MKERFKAICNEHIHRSGVGDLMDWFEKSGFYKSYDRYLLYARDGTKLIKKAKHKNFMGLKNKWK